MGVGAELRVPRAPRGIFSRYGDGSLMDEVMELMQAAAAHTGETDPDVQVRWALTALSWSCSCS